MNEYGGVKNKALHTSTTRPRGQTRANRFAPAVAHWRHAAQRAVSSRGDFWRAVCTAGALTTNKREQMAHVRSVAYSRSAIQNASHAHACQPTLNAWAVGELVSDGAVFHATYNKVPLCNQRRPGRERSAMRGSSRIPSCIGSWQTAINRCRRFVARAAQTHLYQMSLCFARIFRCALGLVDRCGDIAHQFKRLFDRRPIGVLGRRLLAQTAQQQNVARQALDRHDKERL